MSLDRVVFLVEEQPNPSTDFFVLPALTLSASNVVRCGFSDLPRPQELDGAAVVFVRYVPSAWMKLISEERARLRRLVFFMDDDVLDAAAWASMPWRYRFKLARLALLRKGWLKGQKSELWVSTPYLQQKYAAWGARLVLPAPVTGTPSFRRVFYHGSASHEAEVRWLRPVMEEALRCNEQLCFEVVGDRDVYRLYRGLPRVTVVHPMKWPAYQTFLAMPGRHIGLAPLLDLPFNRARSHTKFFDINRCGAVGIYAVESACAEVVEHETDGLLCPMQGEAWVKAILRLAGDESLHAQLLVGARNKMNSLGVTAGRNAEKLFD